MSGEIKGVRTSDGKLHAIDYKSLANRPIPEWDDSNNGDDYGKVLSVGYSGYLEWSRSGGTPDSSGNEGGEVLTVLDTSGTMGWVRLLPEHDGGISGSVLTVDDYGDLEWTTVGGVSTDGASDGDVLVVSDGEATWTPFNGGVLPAWSSNAGSVLAIDEHGDLEWTKSGTISVDDANEGDVLTIGDHGYYGWNPVNGYVLPAWDDSGDDDGKVLGIENGELAWVSV